MSDTKPRRPVPVPDDTSAPFWEAAAAGELVLARCGRCERFAHPPAPVCPHCGSTDPGFRFEPAPSEGVVRSWTVVRQAFLPGFGEEPFVLADVALGDDEDLRLIGRLVDGPEASIEHGARVHVVFEPVGDGQQVPAFALVPT